MKLVNQFFSLALIIVITSCSKEIDYEIQIVNSTDFNIDKFQLGSEDNLSISPNESTASFTINKEKAINVTDPLLSYSTLKFSNADTTYINEEGVGGVISFNELSSKNLNIIKLKVDQSIFFRAQVQ
jgi:hypothetical protein